MQNYPTAKCIAFQKNRTGSWGLPSLYISTSIGMSNSSLTLPHDSNISLPNEYCKKYISMKTKKKKKILKKCTTKWLHYIYILFSP